MPRRKKKSQPNEGAERVVVVGDAKGEASGEPRASESLEKALRAGEPGELLS